MKILLLISRKLVIACFICCLISVSWNAVFSQVMLYEKNWELPTYQVAEPERAPIFFKNEAYQGASRHYYPLPLNDQYTGERIMQEWHTVVLENEYIELAVTPEIGGKLYYATDKTNNYHFIYKNNVVRPSNIGMTGAWVSGGIEWCVMHHHRASTYLPIDYTTVENEDGSKTIWVGEYEPRHGMRWTIGITVRPGRSYFEVEGRIFNSSPFTHTFLYWANVATHTNEHYQAIFPPSAQIATFHSKTDFTHWPISTEVFRGADFTDGVDISWWKNVEESNSFFIHELQEDFMGGYDHGINTGTVHIADHNIVKGAKLWEWGSGQRGQATEGRLTEDDGPYVELMVGAFSDNQPDYSWIRPYEVKQWKQFWYPVRGIEGFKYANLEGAVNLDERGDNSVFLGYYLTKEVPEAKVVLRNKDEIVFEKNVYISPAEPFSETILLDHFNYTDLYTMLIDTGTDELLIEYQPIEHPPVEELPEPWSGYRSPETIETIEELYLEGKRVEQFYAPRHDEMDWYMEALRRDPNDIRTNTAVGNIYLKSGNYKTAREYFSRAVNRLTNNYTRPSDCEALYLQGLTLKALKLYDDAADIFYKATWDYSYHSAAYFQLAQISIKRGDYERALHEINESLWTNARNNRAIALKASILRLLGDPLEAISVIEAIYYNDPLDFRLGNEYCMAVRELGDMDRYGILLESLESKMRGADENYLELAVGYLNDGLLDDAESVLLRYEGGNPLADYYLGYIYHMKGMRGQALNRFNEATSKPVDFIFPHRLETLEVLKTALEYNPEDSKAYYYIGNLMYERQPGYAIENWENAVRHDPTLALAYRNLGWGYYHYHGDGMKAITNYEKSIELDKSQAIYYTELDALYEMSNAPIETRLKLFEGNNDVVINRDDSFIRQIEVLTLAGQTERAVEYLEGVEFAYREGSSRVREILINTQLMMGIQYLNENDFEKALNYFLEAQVPEEEAGTARFGNRDIQVNYFTGLAYESMGNISMSRTFYQQAASYEFGRTLNIMSFYYGLILEKLGERTKANEMYSSMITFADNQLRSFNVSDETGVIFGAREADNFRRSQLYTIRGLGFKGQGQIEPAREDLVRAVELSNSNLWAKFELESIN